MILAFCYDVATHHAHKTAMSFFLYLVLVTDDKYLNLTINFGTKYISGLAS